MSAEVSLMPCAQGALATCTYREVSPIFLGYHQKCYCWVEINWNVLLLIFFSIKYCENDISRFVRGIRDLYLHCFQIFHVRFQVSKYKMSWYIWVAMKLNWCLWVAWNFHGLTPSMRMSWVPPLGHMENAVKKMFKTFTDESRLLFGPQSIRISRSQLSSSLNI